MVRLSKRAWNRWQSWSLPTRIGIFLSLAGLVLTIIFSVWDPKPLLERTFWPKPPIQTPTVVVLIRNPDKTITSMPYRDDFWLWLPNTGGAPHIAGKYEVVISNAGTVKDGIAPIRAPGETRLLLKLMDQDRMNTYLKRGDTEISFIFHRPDGSSFFSEDLPFTEDSVKRYYAKASVAPE